MSASRVRCLGNELICHVKYDEVTETVALCFRTRWVAGSNLSQTTSQHDSFRGFPYLFHPDSHGTVLPLSRMLFHIFLYANHPDM